MANVGRPPKHERNNQLIAEYLGGDMMPALAARYGVSVQRVKAIIDRGYISRVPAEERVVREKRGRSSSYRDSGGSISRFVAPKAEPERSHGLTADHPAVVEGRTLFPTRRTAPMESPRLLISGKNNPKTGDRVLKGPWADMPIFTLTLEERATCPRSCPVWTDCYGNTMQWPRRHDAFDPMFMDALRSEIITVGRAHPSGFVVRLHILGDFFSVAYVKLWADMLDLLPHLRVFGYTARRDDDGDKESWRIARAIRFLTDEAWDRFAIRTSHPEFGPQRSVVVDADPELPDVIVCPAQTGQTAACATCGLCWAPAARNKTIAFLRHGMKTGKGKKYRVKDLPRSTPIQDAEPDPSLDRARARLAQYDPAVAAAHGLPSPKRQERP